MPCRRQNAVSAAYDRAAPLAVSSSWTRTRFPLQEFKRSRICSRWGSAFSARGISGTLVEFERWTLRTVNRDTCSTRAISCLLTPFALSSRIALRCAWLSMSGFLFLSDPFRHPVQFSARIFDPALRLLLLPAVHLRQGFGESAAGAMQDGGGHLQVALEGSRGRRDRHRRPLRFQKQFRLGEDALAHHARPLAPGGVKLAGLPRVGAVLDERCGHAPAMIRAHSR